MATGVRRERVRAGLRCAVAVLAAMLLVTGCGDDAETSGGAGGDEGRLAEPIAVGTGPNTPEPRPVDDRTRVTIAYAAPVTVFATLLLADHFKEFEKENLDVSIEVVPPADATLLVAQGRAQIQLTGVNPGPLNLMGEDAPLRYVAGTMGDHPEEESYYIRKELLGEDGEPDPEKIKGSTVMVGLGGGEYGNSGALAMYRWLGEHGLEPDDIKPVHVPSMSDAAAALERDQVQASLVLSPAWIDVMASDCCVRLDGARSVTNAMYLANNDWLSDQPEVAAAVFRALMRTNRTYLQGDYRDNPETMAALAEVLGQPEDAIAQIPPSEFDPDLGIEKTIASVTDYEDMYRFAELLSYDGNLTSEQLTNTSPVEAVLEGRY